MKENKRTVHAEGGRVVRHSIPSNILFWLKIYWKWEPGVVLLAALELILGALVPLVGIYLPKLVLDMLAGHVTAAVLIRTLGLWGLLAAALYGVSGGLRGKYYVQNSVRSYLMPELFLKSLRVSYEIPESEWGKKAYQEALGVASGGDWSASTRTFDGTLAILQNILCFALYSTVLGVLNPWVVLVLMALSMLNILVIEKGLRFEDSMREREARHGRHWNYILSAMGNMTAAKDVRIFGMHPWLGGIRDRAVTEMEEDKKAYQRLHNWQQAMNGLIGLVRDVAAYGYLIYSVSTGQIGVSDFVLYFGAVTGFSGFVTGMLYQVGDLKSARNATDYFRAYMALPEEVSEEESIRAVTPDAQRNQTGAMTCGEHGGQKLMASVKAGENFQGTDGRAAYAGQRFPAPGIVFEDVGFAYKKEDGTPGEKVLDHFNLTIAPGEKLALVGVNGAGKTTLVKLLCGLYQPDQGRILVNGRSRSEMESEEWYQMLSVVFQEQLVLPITIAENLSLQRREETDDERAWGGVGKGGFIRDICAAETYPGYIYEKDHIPKRH